jgi:hypothetical protein
VEGRSAWISLFFLVFWLVYMVSVHIWEVDVVWCRGGWSVTAMLIHMLVSWSIGFFWIFFVFFFLVRLSYRDLLWIMRWYHYTANVHRAKELFLFDAYLMNNVLLVLLEMSQSLITTWGAHTYN